MAHGLKLQPSGPALLIKLKDMDGHMEKVVAHLPVSQICTSILKEATNTENYKDPSGTSQRSETTSSDLIFKTM